MERLEIQENKAEVHEMREDIFEREIEKEAGLLKKVFASRAMDMGLNFVPPVGVPKMMAEAAFGKTSSGEKLSKEKI